VEVGHAPSQRARGSEKFVEDAQQLMDECAPRARLGSRDERARRHLCASFALEPARGSSLEAACGFSGTGGGPWRCVSPCRLASQPFVQTLHDEFQRLRTGMYAIEETGDDRIEWPARFLLTRHVTLLVVYGPHPMIGCTLSALP
jgi:hypothetical protein